MPNPLSLLIVTVLSSIMSMVVLGSLRPAGIPGVSRWIGANGIAIVAEVLFALQRVAHPLFSILFANVLLALAVVLVLDGCRQFFGLRSWCPPAWSACAALLFAIAWWTWVAPDIVARIVLVSAFHSAIYVAIGWTVLHGQPAGRPAYSYRFVTGAAWLGAFGHAARGFMYACGWATQTSLLQTTPTNVAFLSIGILALPALSIGMVMLAHDRMAQRMERWANFDELTGAMTRRAFVARAEQLIDDAGETGTKLSLAIVDIDHFKSFNDRFGHATGDRVLAQFGRMMSDGLREIDLFGRLGGEEFAVLFPAADREEAAARIDALRVRAQRNGASDGLEQAFTFSAGVDEYRAPESLARLMARADKALYSAKTLGRDRVMQA